LSQRLVKLSYGTNHTPHNVTDRKFIDLLNVLWTKRTLNPTSYTPASASDVDAQGRASPSPAGVPPYEDHARAAAARCGVVGPTPGGPATPPRASPKAKVSHRGGVHVCALRRSTRPGRATYVTSDALRGA
jgi:hypothetical protein